MAGNCSAQSAASTTVTADNVAPNTSITGQPANPTNVTSATFTFTSTELGSTFQCQMDGGAFGACTSGVTTFAGLAAGSHTFAVKATDPAGNTDATPASYTWTIDLTAPDTSITGGRSEERRVGKECRL